MLITYKEVCLVETNFNQKDDSSTTIRLVSENLNIEEKKANTVVNLYSIFSI